MDRIVFLVLGWVLWTNLDVAGQSQMSPWAKLAEPDSLIRKDVIGNEMIIDLVDAWVADSIIEANRQHLKGPGGWIAHHTVARYWQRYTDRKQKYVATSSRPYHIFDGVGDEIDINIFLMPHLPRYVMMVDTGFDIALKRNRKVDAFRFDQPPGHPAPEALKYEDRGYLTVECEVTPPHAFAAKFDEQLIHLHHEDTDFDTMPNFGTKHVSFGLTGVWCMDCNHNCRPEIHPIEWMWWLDLSKQRPGSPLAKSWMAVLMVDDSHRFKNWSQSPISGEIAIPFVVPQGSKTIMIDLDHIASDPIEKEIALQDAERRFQSGDTSFVIPYLPGSGKSPKMDVLLRTHGEWPRNSTEYWLSDLQPGPDGISGYLHLSTTVLSLLAFRATIDSE